MNYPLSLFHIEDDIFDEEECESIINQIEHGRNSGAPLMLPNIDVEYIHTPDLNKKHKFWDVLKKLSWVEKVEEGDRTFLKYEISSVNQCHNDLYDDNKFTCIFFLNEDYRGGELKLYTWSKDTCTFPVELKPKTNSMVIFPSFIYHSVNEVKDGTRYVYTKFLK